MPAWAAVAAAGGFAARVGSRAGLVKSRMNYQGKLYHELSWFGKVNAVGAAHEGVNAGKRAWSRRNNEK